MDSFGLQHRVRDQWSRTLLPAELRRCLPIALALLVSCSSGEPSGDRRSSVTSNHPPAINEAVILPTPIVLSGPLMVRVDAQDLDGQNVVFRYRWFVNGQAVAGQVNASFPQDSLKRGDRVAVEVTPFDGIAEGAPLRSATAVVTNTPPIISHVSVEYDQAVRGKQLVANVDVQDPDHDQVTLSYRWMQNEKVLQEGEMNRIEAAGLTAKDPIHVEVTATDGGSNGITTVKGQFRMSNSLPTIVSRPPSSVGGGQYAYLVQATDLDGDSIAYLLEVGPPGMTINSETGQIIWVPSPEVQGVYPVRIVAKDSQGGFASQEFELSLARPAGQS